MFGNLEKNRVEKGYLELFAPERRHLRDVASITPRRPPPYPGRACTPRHQNTPRSEARRHRHCAPKAIDARKWPRPVPRGLPTLAGRRTASLHWLPAAARRQPPPRPCRRHYGQRRLGETALERYWTIETLPGLPRSRSRPAAVCHRPPLAPPVNSHFRLRP
jgi:hypothetical protein